MNLSTLYSDAVYLNYKNIRSLLERNKGAIFLDLGCDDGMVTMKMARVIHPAKIIGVDLVDKSLKKAKAKGINTLKADLNSKLPIESNSIDVIHANQVIEHVSNLDLFISEILRTLRPGGYAVISTENASSWCNIFALIFGWQMFSLTNISSKVWSLGNPLALHNNEANDLSTWTHKTILSIRGLKELAETWDFKVEEIKGAGYFPLPAFLGNIDKTHCHFMTIKIRKKMA